MDVFVISWRGQHEKAGLIAEAVRVAGYKVVIIYSDPSDSVVFPKSITTVRRPDNLFWADKLTACIERLSSDYMMVIHADCLTEDWSQVVAAAQDAFSRLSNLAVWSADVRGTYWDIRFTELAKIGHGSLAAAVAIDSLVFAVNRAVVNRLRAARLSTNPFGWGIDTLACCFAHRTGGLIAVDKSVVVKHVGVTGYCEEEAREAGQRFLQEYEHSERIYYAWIHSTMRSRYRLFRLENDATAKAARAASHREQAKSPKRYDVINDLLGVIGKRETRYLEIGVRDPEENFNKVRSAHKMSVDSGLNNPLNPLDSTSRSDDSSLNTAKTDMGDSESGFDVIFLDRYRLAAEAYRDAMNALDLLNKEGCLVMRYCNPPTEFHARETAECRETPAGRYWSGTTWKAFVMLRQRPKISACCVDSDWGIGVISRNPELFASLTRDVVSPFCDYSELEKNREHLLGLISYERFTSLIRGG
ncbi:hypothetical protein [Allochromatium palmeri]|uniref:Uncharacterized protein n=1 Tax=Allochromatium palmeri TaxID=231048 RepID=A0A6N8EI96_9GAMM|nr:hypothetical protein [Allochromatium palmeri]MTW22768.1 hypothetical protein [Allochromatium palmeri]